MSMRLECNGINYQYPSAECPLFQNLEFALDGPGFHALFGPSGVGKTTLARMLTDRFNDHGGSFTLEGGSIILYSYNLERLPDWAGIGTHLERVAVPGTDAMQQDLIELFGLSALLDARFSKLSLGQKNRINLIRYLLQDFDVLIMDESLANVDEKTRESILLGIKKRFPDKFFLYISHNIVEVAKFCRKILVLRSPGKVPQGMLVDGLDIEMGDGVERQALERSMLEIMNAA